MVEFYYKEDMNVMACGGMRDGMGQTSPQCEEIKSNACTRNSTIAPGSPVGEIQ